MAKTEKKKYGCKYLWRVTNEMQIAIDTEGYVYIRQKNLRHSMPKKEVWNAWQTVDMNMANWTKEDPSKVRVGGEYMKNYGYGTVDKEFLQTLGMHLELLKKN